VRFEHILSPPFPGGKREEREKKRKKGTASGGNGCYRLSCTDSATLAVWEKKEGKRKGGKGMGRGGNGAVYLPFLPIFICEAGGGDKRGEKRKGRGEGRVTNPIPFPASAVRGGKKRKRREKEGE